MSRWRKWFDAKQEEDLERELRAHLDLEAEEQQESGVPAEEARYAALRAFGNRALVKEAIREMWSLTALEGFLQDIRYSLRSLRKKPGFTAVAVLTLALGIGANTAIFSVINSALLRALPFRDPGKLVQLWETESSPGNFPLTGPDYLDWQAQNETLQESTLYGWPNVSNATTGGQPVSLSMVKTQANFFALLGVKPLAGRTFASGEDQEGKDHVAVLSYGAWQRVYGGRSDTLGKTIDINAEPYTIIGVMPPGFNFPAGTHVWAPLVMTEKALGNRGTHSYRAIGRIKSGVKFEQAQADLVTVSKRISRQSRGADDPSAAVLVPLKEQLTGSSRTQLLVLWGAVALVLLVACANVANLLLARATARQREIALRVVLGASRWRVVRQLLTESVFLSLMGAGLGLAGAWWTVGIMGSAEKLPLPKANPLQVDVTVLFFTMVVSVLVGLLFGLVPAFHASRVDLGEELKASAQAVVSPAGWRRRLRDSLVVAEIAVSLALLIGAGLLLRTFARMRNTDIGVQSQNVLTMSIKLPDKKYEGLVPRRRFFDQLLERVQHLPGIQAASFSTSLPLRGGSNGYISVPGDTNPAHATQLVENNYITPDYFHALGVPVLQGTTFTQADMNHAAEVNMKIEELFRLHPDTTTVPPELGLTAVINRRMANMYWPGQDPVGKQYSWNGISVKVVGVVGDVKQWDIRKEAIPENYFPLTLAMDSPWNHEVLVVKSGISPEAVVAPIRDIIRELDPKLAAFDVITLDEAIALAMQETSLQTWLLGSFAGLALVLAAVGLYSVLAYLVTQRTREIGIRMALGAQRMDLVRMVVGHGATLTAIGMIIGVIGALGLTQLLTSLLFGVTATDPATFGAVVLVLSLVALAASYIPARRATRVDPIVALRHD